jgi:6-phosphogluconolactonase
LDFLFGNVGRNSFDNSSSARIDWTLEMKNFELISFANAGELASRAASAWLDEIESANRSGKSHCVALSGGRITQKFFASTVEQAKMRAISFSCVHFFWADERCVPPTDPESNFKLADGLLFAPLKISGSQMHRIHGELSPVAAAVQAVSEISHLTPQNSEGRPVLDLIFLGMGEDGHVASLFPNATAEIADCTTPFLAVENSPKPPPNRITLSYLTIAAAKQVLVLASGAGKEAALRDSLNFSGKTPLARVIQSRSNTTIFSDFRLNEAG